LLTSCREVAAGLGTLRSGPLGLLASAGAEAGASGGAEAPEDVPASRPETPGQAGQAGAPGDLPKSFVILVDGVGSFLVFRGAQVSVGPISSSRRPDVGLMADANMPVATILRAEEDYFLRADSPVEVNGRPVTNELLRHGDRIALAARCRMKFLRPNAASTSAVLALTGARLGRKDVRHVVLMGRELVLGPGPSAHLRAEGLADQIVLYVRDDKLYCRSQTPVMAGGRPMDSAAGIPMDTPVRAGEVSFVITGASYVQ